LGTAAHYAKGRPPYAPQLASVLAQQLGLDGHGRLLDVGCGPGIVTLAFAPVFEAVVGLDPEPEMLAEAARAAAEVGIDNASWVQMRAEMLPGSLGTFRVVSFAQSFHWMERIRVARATRQMLDSGGAVVLIDRSPLSSAGSPAPDDSPPIPEKAIDQLRVQWLGPDRRAGQGFRNTSPSDEDEVFQSAGFAPEEIVVVPDGRVLQRSIDEVVAWVLSTSWTAPHLFGTRLSRFETDLGELLRDASPAGLFALPLPDNRLRIWRPR
jgi:SAM-dependent methyltransferase